MDLRLVFFLVSFARRDKWGSEVLWVTVTAGRYGALGSISKTNDVEPRKGPGHDLLF